jgi:DNA-binding transcriptional regulator LsrR (DeoR family)
MSTGVRREETTAMAEAARLHYLEGLTKQEVGTRLGLSRFKVARLLERARAEGVVRIEVREPARLDDELSLLVQRQFGLRAAVVVRGDDPADLARAAAARLDRLLGPRDVLGVSWGATLEAVVEALPGREGAGPDVVQICGAIAGTSPGEGPSELAWSAAERLRGRLHLLPAPALAGTPGTRRALVRNAAIGPTLAMFPSVTVALLGIGSLEVGGRSSLLASGAIPHGTLSRLRGRGAVGDLLVHVFDARGRMIPTGLAGRTVAMSLAELRAVPTVVAAAGGAGKEAAVGGALRTGLVDVLVTDDARALAALREGR